MASAGKNEGGASRHRLTPEGVLSHAQAALGKGDPAGAARMLKEVLDRHPENAACHDMMAGVLYLSGRHADALHHARRAAELSPNTAKYLRGEASILAALERNDEAIAKLRDVLALTPDDAEARNDLGASYMKAGRLEEAEAQFRRAIDDAPTAIPPRSNLEMLLMHQGRVAEAEHLYRDLLKRAPDDPGILLHLARVSFQSNRVAAADELLQQALDLEPRFVEALLLAAEVKACLGSYKEGLALARRARSREPKNARALETLGRIYLACHRPKDALKAYREAAKIQPLSIESLTQLSLFGADQWGFDLCRAIGTARRSILTGDPRVTARLDLAMARALDRLGDHEAAWRHAIEANRAFCAYHGLDSEPAVGPTPEIDLSQLGPGAGGESQIRTSGDGRPPFVIVTGMSRSGKSTLEDVIATVPGVKVAYESNIFAEVAADIVEGPEFDHENVPKDLMSGYFSPYQQGLQRKLDEKAGDCTAFVITIFFQYLMRNIGNILNMIPNSYFVFLDRDIWDNALRIFFYDYATSEHSYAYRLSSIMREIEVARAVAETWVTAAPDRCLLVRYDEMVADPASVRDRICAFCDLPVPDLPPKPVFDDSGCAAPYRQLMEACLRDEGWPDDGRGNRT